MPSHWPSLKILIDRQFTLETNPQLIFSMFFAGCMLLAVPINIPISLVNGEGDAGGVTGLPTMTLTNFGQGWSLWFHLVLTYIFCGMFELGTA